MKKFLFLLLLIGSGQLFAACNKGGNLDADPKEEDPDTTTLKNYDVLGLGEIPIGLWVTPPQNSQTSDEYARIKECGINFVNGFYFHENSNSRIINVLNHCESNGLKYFANRATVTEDILRYAQNPNAELLTKFTNGVMPYANHAAFAGELLMDEPGKNLFGAVSAFASAFEKNYPDKLWHVNLFPSYATGGIQASNYADYINTWMEKLSPRFISYDSYPLLTDGTIIRDYYSNLDFIRAKSRFSEIPFWTFVQTLSIAGTPGLPDKREPTEADIRWQVWSHLAFGAKGIQYFCYWSPGNGTEQFGDALIDLNGEKTVRYDYVKNLNSDINRIGKILLNCHAEGVIQTAVQNYTMYAPLYSFGEIVSVTGDDNIVGCFQDEDGNKKVLITTLRPNEDANVILNLSNNVHRVKVWRNEAVTEVSASNNKLEFLVKAGNAVFVEF